MQVVTLFTSHNHSDNTTLPCVLLLFPLHITRTCAKFIKWTHNVDGMLDCARFVSWNIRQIRKYFT